MVRTIQPWHMNALEKNIEREKKNIHICLNPILSPEEERQSVAARQGALRVDQVLFRCRNFCDFCNKIPFNVFLLRMRKARIEQTAMAPTFAEDNIKHLMHNVKWEQ